VGNEELGSFGVIEVALQEDSLFPACIGTVGQTCLGYASGLAQGVHFVFMSVDVRRHRFIQDGLPLAESDQYMLFEGSEGFQ